MLGLKWTFEVMKKSLTEIDLNQNPLLILETKMRQLKYVWVVQKKSLWTLKIRITNATVLLRKTAVHFIT